MEKLAPQTNRVLLRGNMPIVVITALATGMERLQRATKGTPRSVGTALKPLRAMLALVFWLATAAGGRVANLKGRNVWRPLAGITVFLVGCVGSYLLLRPGSVSVGTAIRQTFGVLLALALGVVLYVFGRPGPRRPDRPNQAIVLFSAGAALCAMLWRFMDRARFDLKEPLIAVIVVVGIVLLTTVLFLWRPAAPPE